MSRSVRAYTVVREVFRLERLLGRHRGAGQPAPDQRAVDALPRGPPAARPQHPVAGAAAAGEHRHRRRGRALPARPSTSWCRRCRASGRLRAGAAAAAVRGVLRSRCPRRPRRAGRRPARHVLPARRGGDRGRREGSGRRGGGRLLLDLRADRGRPDADPDHRRCLADDRWSALARSALRYDLYAALAGLTQNVLTSTSSTDPPKERIDAWEQQNAEGVARAEATLAEIVSLDTFDLATLSVALRTIRTLLRG